MEKVISLEDGARVAVVGGGPAGSFFAIRALRKAREQRKKIELLIFERKKELQYFEASHSISYREGCNYCAGGISPRLNDVLRENCLVLPADIVRGSIRSLTIHGNWKNVELAIPEGRQMLLVYRGSRPKGRALGYYNFDSYLLDKAREEGAQLITGEVREFGYSDSQKPRLRYHEAGTFDSKLHELEVDFAVFAVGVNQTVGMLPNDNPLVQSIQKVIPQFKPPQVRRALIFELNVGEDFTNRMDDELYFIEYGSRDLHIEMSSLAPKGPFITVALLGRSIDELRPGESLDLVNRFLDLPHVKRLLPHEFERSPACLCNPNMTVGTAAHGFGHRVGMIGDMVVSRLYKDGILAAYVTASALVDCAFGKGIDRQSLAKTYWPTIRKFCRDNRIGSVVFSIQRLTFGNPILSRIFYQAVLTERKTDTKGKRRLENIVWKIASGDDTYLNIFRAMHHPLSIWRIFAGGLLVTLRNYLTELLFGLEWEGFGRYTTGVSKETLEAKRQELFRIIGWEDLANVLDFERMYSIKIRAEQGQIFSQLGKFGDKDREYFKPKMIKVHRTAGGPNELASVIEYRLPSKRLSFSIRLEKIVNDRYLVYRVCNGFARGGVLVFDIEQLRDGLCMLSIYLAFNFPRKTTGGRQLYWSAFKLVFPDFVHDVVWNESLCKFKDIVERK